MRKSILLSLLFVSVISLTGQITVNRSHVIKSGQVVVQASDTNKYTVQTGGTSKTWDFSTLKTIETDIQAFNPPQWYKGYTAFPDANIASTSSMNDSSFTFIKINDNELTIKGSCELIGDTFETYPFERTILTFPSTYNTSFTRNSVVPYQTFPFKKDIDSSGPLPFIDSIKISGQTMINSTIIGWGNIVTPLGTYPALLQSMREINGPKFEMYTSGIWLTIPPAALDLFGWGGITADTAYQHQFWTNDGAVGFPIVGYDYRQGETTTNNVNWLVTKPQNNHIQGTNKNNFASFYPNPCHTSFNVILENNASANLTICDMNGRLVKTLSVENGSVVDMSELANGVYTLKYQTVGNNAELLVQKIIKY